MIEVIKEDSFYLAINKPSGIFSQAPNGISSVQREIQNQLRQRDNHPGNPFVGLPHRLDRPTSGVMLIAKNQRCLKRLSQQFQSRKINKFYVGIVRGNIGTNQTAWEDWIEKVPDLPIARIVTGESQTARLARLEVREIARTETHSALLFKLLTGRMHQIRVQCSARQIPILGDCKYEQYPGQPMEDFEKHPIALHALRIEFHHPQNAVLTSASADIPPWQEMLAQSAAKSEELAVLCRELHQISEWSKQHESNCAFFESFGGH